MTIPSFMTSLMLLGLIPALESPPNISTCFFLWASFS